MRNEPDFMCRAVVRTPALRVVTGSFRELCAEGIRRHDADPVAGRLLSGILAGSALMSALLDEGERYTIRIDCSGPVRGLLAEASADGSVRALVRNPHVMNEADSVEMACGEGGSLIQVTRSRDGKILNSGEARSAFRMPASALGYFLSVSDQVESEMRCEIELQADPASPVRRAEAVLIQAMPGCDLVEFDRVRQRLLMPEAGALLRGRHLSEDPLGPLLMFLLKCEKPDFVRFDMPAARFRCGCSAERMRSLMRQMLSREELEELFARNSEPSVRCEFCGASYRFTRVELLG